MSALQQMLAGIGGAGATYAAISSSSSFTVPAGVTQISMFALGGGAGGNDITAGGGAGGGGGALSITNNVSVTPGETLTIEVGAAGARGIWTGGGVPGTSGDGGYSRIKRGATDLVEAAGGLGVSGSTGGAGGASVYGTGTVKLSGGAGGDASASEFRGGQGGGCASLPDNSTGTAGATATTDYRGGGDGNGVFIGAPPMTSLTVGGGTVNATGLDGTAPSAPYRGGGGGGGAYNSDFSIAGIGAPGVPGIVILLWGGRVFTPGSGSF